MSLELSAKAKRVKPSSTLQLTARAKAMRAKGINVVGFVAGEPDFDTPRNICDAAVEAIYEGYTKYTPASGSAELKEAIANKYKTINHVDYDASQVVVTNGGKHALINTMMALLNPGDEVIIPTPYWLSYPEMVMIADGVPVFIEAEKENSYKITPEQLRSAITDKTKAFIFNTPSNPTGQLYTRAEMEEIANVVIENDIYIISDEIYEYLVYGETEHISIASLNDEIYKRTITCNGVAKSYAMTGWRIGYVCAPKEIAKLISSIQSHCTSNPCSISQRAALEALSGSQKAVEIMRKEFDKRRRVIYEKVKEIDKLEAIEPQGAFYLFVDCSKLCEMNYKGEKIGDAKRIAEILLDDYQVAVIPCSDFGADKHIRLSYAISMEHIEEGVRRIKKFVEEL